jgi:hypothetical protein
MGMHGLAHAGRCAVPVAQTMAARLAMVAMVAMMEVMFG